MAELNEFELLLLKTIIDHNADKFNYLPAHLDFIRTESIKASSTGLHITFAYSKDFDEDAEYVNGLLSTELKLISPKLKNELTYCLDVTNGKMDFLEIVTNEKEIWDGDLAHCSLISASE